MAENRPDLAAEVTRLQAELDARTAAFDSLQGYVRGQRMCLAKLAEDLAQAQRETREARDFKAAWRGLLADAAGAARRLTQREETV